MTQSFSQQADEVGAIIKNPHGKIHIALVYPNTYAVGMSNLGFQTLYRLFNSYADIACERAFLPDLPQPAATIRTVETGTALAEMDIIAFSVSYELDYPHIPRILLQSGIEPFRQQRTGPLVIAGGATLCYNPEPIAPFLDSAFIGEVEEQFDVFVASLRHACLAGSAADFPQTPGVYVPSAGAHPVVRQHVRDIDQHPTATCVYTPHTEFGHMALIEVGRGCPYGCRFCVASHVYRPARWRSLATLLPQIDLGLRFRKRIGLIGASVTDHPDIIRLCEEIICRGGEPSPASMRADTLTPELLTLLVQGGVRSITLAPETALETFRMQVGKKLSDDAIFTATQRAKDAGIRQMKLYFIIGLPGETEADLQAIPSFVQRLGRETAMPLHVGCSAFVPKPGTPFAREAMNQEKELKRKFTYLQRHLRGIATLTHESARWTFWQTVLARGGTELAVPLARIARAGKSPAAWKSIFQECSIDAAQYAYQRYAREVVLPWEHISAPNTTGICCSVDDNPE